MFSYVAPIYPVYFQYYSRLLFNRAVIYINVDSAVLGDYICLQSLGNTKLILWMTDSQQEKWNKRANCIVFFLNKNVDFLQKMERAKKQQFFFNIFPAKMG